MERNRTRMNMLSLLRPALFHTDPETAHHLTLCGLNTAYSLGMSGIIAARIPDDPRSAFLVPYGVSMIDAGTSFRKAISGSPFSAALAFPPADSANFFMSFGIASPKKMIDSEIFSISEAAIIFSFSFLGK